MTSVRRSYNTHRDRNGWTRSQVRVVRLLDRGFTYPEAAAYLEISINTLKSHLRNLAERHDLRGGRYAILHEARRLGYLDRNDHMDAVDAEGVFEVAELDETELRELLRFVTTQVHELDDYVKWLASRGTVPAKLANWPRKILARINTARLEDGA